MKFQELYDGIENLIERFAEEHAVKVQEIRVEWIRNTTSIEGLEFQITGGPM